MCNITFMRWISNAAARISGTRGAVSVQARQVGCSRQAIYADFRGHLTCLFHTQFPPRTGRFFLVFLAFEGRDMGAL